MHLRTRGCRHCRSGPAQSRLLLLAALQPRAQQLSSPAQEQSIAVWRGHRARERSTVNAQPCIHSRALTIQVLMRLCFCIMCSCSPVLQAVLEAGAQLMRGAKNG
jgi:hypothetical protein